MRTTPKGTAAMAKGRIIYQLWVGNQADAVWARDQVVAAMDKPKFATVTEPDYGPTIRTAHWGQLMVEGSTRFDVAGDDAIIQQRIESAWSSGQGAKKILPGSWAAIHACLHDEGGFCSSPTRAVKA